MKSSNNYLDGQFPRGTDPAHGLTMNSGVSNLAQGPIRILPAPVAYSLEILGYDIGFAANVAMTSQGNAAPPLLTSNLSVRNINPGLQATTIGIVPATLGNFPALSTWTTWKKGLSMLNQNAPYDNFGTMGNYTNDLLEPNAADLQTFRFAIGDLTTMPTTSVGVVADAHLLQASVTGAAAQPVRSAFMRSWVSSNFWRFIIAPNKPPAGQTQAPFLSAASGVIDVNISILNGVGTYLLNYGFSITCNTDQSNRCIEIIIPLNTNVANKAETTNYLMDFVKANPTWGNSVNHSITISVVTNFFTQYGFFIEPLKSRTPFVQSLFTSLINLSSI